MLFLFFLAIFIVNSDGSCYQTWTNMSVFPLIDLSYPYDYGFPGSITQTAYDMDLDSCKQYCEDTSSCGYIVMPPTGPCFIFAQFNPQAFRETTNGFTVYFKLESDCSLTLPELAAKNSTQTYADGGEFKIVTVFPGTYMYMGNSADGKIKSYV